ncbi:hypothetical protein AUEXF2481DRAFT_40169 [Aureobasidium subglaciale EXF-2481]|uniref:Uncharacterized protein n=1 Tax=Aureobasidium subglaciale (strain EXF-2481) TaxID=1043005 RepID=A0A074YLD5_AURSE|nr:uncharacterized protein AUEXF2481DRAFT_40169 [Aureobasidium subglaciale EXF-2481]KEQ94932.1 hypothetical protein AUEXF2481DRAFT_40169 [Aureobasidium subglaciale EXF-2481]
MPSAVVSCLIMSASTAVSDRDELGSGAVMSSEFCGLYWITRTGKRSGLSRYRARLHSSTASLVSLNHELDYDMPCGLHRFALSSQSQTE